MFSTHDFIPPPPVTPPAPAPPIKTQAFDGSRGATSSSSYNPSLLIITAILAFVCIASASIHLLLRSLCRSSSSSSPPLIHRTASSNSATTTSSASSLFDSLPLFSLASSVATLPKTSTDCAVCLSRFQPHDQLRLLPACRHAFHSPCIDTWLRSTPSCPLCRSSIHAPPPPPSPEQQPMTSDSFRLEIGSVSRRTDDSPPPVPHLRSYSLGSSFEYRVEGEVEAVVARVLRREGGKDGRHPVSAPPPPGAEVAEAAGGGGSWWLRGYVDRMASSASSSFSSLRFSSCKFDGGSGGGWDLEGDGASEEGHLSAASYR